MAVGGWAERAGAARSRDAWAIRWSAVLLLLNLLDGAFTTVFLQLDVAVEANPLMRAAYERSPLLFMASKMVLVQAGVLALWWCRETKAARYALVASASLYSAIVGWHVFVLARLVAG